MAVSGRRALDNLLSTTLRLSSQAGAIVSCHPCGLSGQIVNAKGYCQNCRKYLCNSCISSHEKATPTRKHIVNKNFEFTSTADANGKLQSCSTHPNEDVKLYCRAHGRLGCVICMTLSHKLCEIDFIPEVSEQFVKSDEYLSFETNVSNIKERCSIGLSKIEANIIDIETEYANVISAVEKTKKEIIEELDKFEGELKDKVTTYRKKNIETMDTLKKAYESVVKNIEDKEAITKSMIKDKKYNLLFCEVKQAFAMVSEYQSQTYELSTRLGKQECKFQKNSELNTFLTKEKMFGTIHIKDLELGSCNAQERVSTHPICHINIKGKNDKKTCYATGLAFMSSNQLAVADKANKNVKIVDVSYNKMISEIMLSSSPRDITVIPTNQLAVTLRDEKIIQLLSTASGLTKTEQIKTDGKCRGIYFDSGILFVTFDNIMPKLQMMNLNGEVIRSFEVGQQGKSLTSQPKSICLSPGRNQIYFTDYIKMTIARISIGGEFTAEYKLSNFLGLAVSTSGSVYACAKTCDTVIQFSDDLSKATTVVNENVGVRGPLALALSEKKNNLYVSCGKGDETCCNRLHVFKIT